MVGKRPRRRGGRVDDEGGRGGRGAARVGAYGVRCALTGLVLPSSTVMAMVHGLPTVSPFSLGVYSWEPMLKVAGSLSEHVT